MRCSSFVCILLVPLGAAAGCATSNAGKVCDPVASWEAPAYRCVSQAATPAPVPTPVGVQPAPRRAEIKGERIELKETVEFKTGSAELLPASDGMLDEVVQIMKEHPEIGKIRIEGHTDSTGTPDGNQKLSEARAAAVQAYLAAHGVAVGRLGSKGFGQDRPIADNKTEAGRADNRRVEIHIEERK